MLFSFLTKLLGNFSLAVIPFISFTVYSSHAFYPSHRLLFQTLAFISAVPTALVVSRNNYFALPTIQPQRCICNDVHWHQCRSSVNATVHREKNSV